MARVFVSHSSEDRELADEVHGWLTHDGHEVFLDHDLREGIALGEEWEQRLHERLRWADAVVCLVTSAYLASAWCAAEVGIARSRGSRLLPLLAEPGVVHPLLPSTQYADLARDPIASRQALAAALRRVDAAGGRGWPDGRSPFPGLRPFDVDQQRVFFGRAGEVKALAGLLRSPAERTGGAVVLVVGPSGCGKSSLVRAGLVPMMVDEPGWWTVAPFVPGADPVAALTRELAAAARQVDLGWTVAQVRERLEDGRLGELTDELLLAAPLGGRRRHLLVVVDQFEELLTQTPPAARARFAELLRPALDNPVQVVATLRPESLAQLLASPELAGLPTRVFALRPLRRDTLAAVIEGPARLAGIEVDGQLVDRLVGDTNTGEALPLLAFTLEQLADGVRRGGQLSEPRYERLGGVQGALIRQADTALADAVAASGRTTNDVIAGLLRLVTVDEEGHPTRWRVDREELPGPVRTELDAFVARRLLTTDTDDGTVVLGVAHEAFLSAWPPLAGAITAAASGLRMRRSVEQAAAEWVGAGRPPSRLWERGQLAAALTDTGARTQPATLSDGRPAAVTSSMRHQRLLGWLPRRNRVLVTDKVELSQRARDFLHTSIRVDRRRRRRATTILSVLLVLAVAAAGVAVNRQRAAQRQQQVAIARGLVAQADETRESDPRIALLLGIAAQHIDPSSESQAGLVNTLTTTNYAATLTGHNNTVIAVAFARDGKTLATGSFDRTAILWDVTDRRRPRRLGQPLTGHNDEVTAVAFAPDGHTLATASVDATVILWDLTDRSRPRRLGQPLTGHNYTVTTVAFAPDGKTLATGSLDHTAILWDVSDRSQPRRLGQPLTGHTNDLWSVAFAPDGKTLATASEDRTVILWDLADRSRPRRLSQPLTGHSDAAQSVAFAPGGHTLATASDDRTVILWDVTDRRRPRRLGQPLRGHTSDVWSVAFAPDGKTLATASSDATVILWDVSDRSQPRRLGQPLTGHTSAVLSVAFAPDGQTLATGSFDHTAILWDLADRSRPRRLGQPLTDHNDTVTEVAFAPDGKTLATGSFDHTAILWDLADRSRPRRLGQPLTGHSDAVRSVAFAPGGHTLATASDDRTVSLWDLADRSRPRRLGQFPTGHNNAVTSVAFAPDGNTLATTSIDRTVSLWDVSDRTRPRRIGQPLMGHTSDLWSVAFAPNGKTLATASDDGTVILWDLTDRNRPRRLSQPLTGHSSRVTAVAFAPNGNILATASVDATVILWDLTDRTRPRRLGQPLRGHSDAVHSVAFAPDGNTLATTSSDATVILWDVTDRNRPRRLSQPLTGHNNTVIAVAFAPDGNTLASGSVDQTAILWDLADLNNLRRHAAERACSLTQRGLDREEWARYVRGLPYQETCQS
jgi:WD40 repeat protein